MLENFLVFQMAKKFYKGCKRLRIHPFLMEQLIRASGSVALNIAEGSVRRTAMDQRRFYSIALGSLRECEAVFELEDIDDPELRDPVGQIGAILYKISKTEREKSRK